MKVGEGDWSLAEAISLDSAFASETTPSVLSPCFACGFWERSLISKDGDSVHSGGCGGQWEG